jgi:hypothetical protein
VWPFYVFNDSKWDVAVIVELLTITVNKNVDIEVSAFDTFLE